jgi:hypothetical protein
MENSRVLNDRFKDQITKIKLLEDVVGGLKINEELWAQCSDAVGWINGHINFAKA